MGLSPELAILSHVKSGEVFCFILFACSLLVLLNIVTYALHCLNMSTQELNWSTHIQYVTKKVLKACGAIAKLRHCVDITTLKTVYYSLVHSYVRYGLLMTWGNAASSALMIKPTIYYTS